MISPGFPPSYGGLILSRNTVPVWHFNVSVKTLRVPLLWLQGEFVTWSKLSTIGANCAIEQCLDDCMRKVKAWEVAARPAGSQLKSGMTRIPSSAYLRTAHSMQNMNNAGVPPLHPHHEPPTLPPLV